MQDRENQCRPREQTDAGRAGRLPKLHWARVFACIAAVTALTGVAQPGQQPTPGMPIRDEMPPIQPQNNRVPDANDQMRMHEQQTQKQDFAAANAERRKQIADDSAKLLKLATDLKTEVDKTTKDTLSLGVIRKADEIEKLAHNVKEKMKLTVGQS